MFRNKQAIAWQWENEIDEDERLPTALPAVSARRHALSISALLRI